MKGNVAHSDRGKLTDRWHALFLIGKRLEGLHGRYSEH